MSYRIFTNPDDTRVIAIDENGDGFLFTPDTAYKRQFSMDRLIYDAMGGLWVGEELFGAEVDRDKMQEAMDAANEYWSNRYR